MQNNTSQSQLSDSSKLIGTQEPPQNEPFKVENIKVAVRVRPLNEVELTISDFETIRVVDQQTIILVNPSVGLDVQEDQLSNFETEFNYTSAFDKLSSQKEVYDKVISKQIDELFSGFNVAISSYGTTGSGKTFTMLNNQENYGIIPRSLNQLFTSIELKKDQIEVNVFASIIEIYNENLRDLQQNKDIELEIREDSIRGVIVNNLIEKAVFSTTEVMNLLRLSIRNRTAENSNKISAATQNSHEFLTITLEIRDKNKIEIVKISKLQLIDLGGSEKGTGKGTKINTSLTVLVNCIQSLYEGKEKGMNFIPYRNSKLTRLMKESLGGNCKTVFVACVSPAVTAYDETLNTLNYAKKLLSIQHINKPNVVAQEQMSASYVALIEKLRTENDQLKKLVATQSNQSKQILPVIINDHERVTKVIQDKIEQHFQTERELSQQIFLYETECTTICIRQEQYPEVKLMDKEANITRVKKQVADNLKQLEEYQLKIEHQREEFNMQFEKRQLLYADIAASELPPISQNFLVSLVKQGVLGTENLEIKQSEQRHAQIKEQQDKQLDMLRSQLYLRDKVIQDQSLYLTSQSQYNSQHQNDMRSSEEIMRTSKQANQPIHNEFINHSYLNKEAYGAQRKYMAGLSQSRLQKIGIKSTPVKVEPYKYQSMMVKKNKGLHHYSSTTNVSISSLPSLVNKTQEDQKTKNTNENSRIKSDSKSGQLPPIKRNLEKFEYDWMSGGYNLKVGQPPTTPSSKKKGLGSTNKFRIASPTRNYSPGRTKNKSFYKYKLQNNSMQPVRPQSGMSQHESPQGHDVLMNDHRVLLPGQVEESPYVKSFLKDQEVSRRKRLLQLNQNLKIQQDIEDGVPQPPQIKKRILYKN